MIMNKQMKMREIIRSRESKGMDKCNDWERESTLVLNCESWMEKNVENQAFTQFGFMLYIR